MMDHIRQRDWNSTRNLYNQFVDERDIDDCVVERVIRNQFWDPMISSDEEEPPGPINWDAVFNKKGSKDNPNHRFVPGFHKMPPQPKLSALSQSDHKQCIRVLSVENKHVLPREFVGKPLRADRLLFEEKQEILAKEREEYIEWAKHLWTTTNCIRALRPKPLIEEVYEAEFKMKSQMIQCFPKSYKLAAQIPLKAENHTCDMVLPKHDLLKVDISKLPMVSYPDIYESKVCILQNCPLPKPCPQHPSKFKLPNENKLSLLPMTEIHAELAQLALDNSANFVASENSVKCLLETDRTWCLLLSVCEVIGPDGDKSNVIVLGREFPDKKDPAPVRSYKAFKHLLQHAFTAESSRRRTFSDSDNMTPMSLRPRHHNRTNAASNTDKRPLRSNTNPSVDSRTVKANVSAMKKIAECQASDSDDDERLEIVIENDSQFDPDMDDENANNMTNDNYNINGDISTELDNQPRKILKARPRLSVDGKTKTENIDATIDSPELGKSDGKSCEISNRESNHAATELHSHESSKMDLDSSQTDPESSKMDTESINHINKGNTSQKDQFEVGRLECVCKGTEFEVPPARSYKRLQIKNHTTKENVNILVHSSHKLRSNESREVELEPIVEYQVDIGGTVQSPHKIHSLAFSLMLRKNADLANVRVDGTSGEVVTIDKLNMRDFTASHGDLKPHIANTLYTACNQLVGLLPGAYLLKHEPSHGTNAVLYSPGSGAGCGPLQAPDTALSPAEEARLVQAAPRLAPVLLPIHKYRRQLPLTFTYNAKQVAKENNKTMGRNKIPPAAIKWPKKGRKGKK